MSKKNKGNRLAPQVQTPPNSVQTRQARVQRAAVLATRVTLGPIPSADELERYRQVQPDLPERIMRQFERRTGDGGDTEPSPNRDRDHGR